VRCPFDYPPEHSDCPKTHLNAFYVAMSVIVFWVSHFPPYFTVGEHSFNHLFLLIGKLRLMESGNNHCDFSPSLASVAKCNVKLES